MVATIDDDHLAAANPIDRETREQGSRYRLFAHFGGSDAPSGIRTRFIDHGHVTAQLYLEMDRGGVQFGLMRSELREPSVTRQSCFRGLVAEKFHFR
jgi:hypothetical protein